MKFYKKSLIFVISFLFLILSYISFFSPVNEQTVFQSIPHHASIAGTHFNVRHSWRSQLSAPVLQNIFSAYDLNAKDIARQPGVFWTFLLAIDNFLVTAFNPETPNSSFSLSAASPASYREPILRLFLALRWIPGLGRLTPHPKKSCYYINIASKNDEKPLYLILDIHHHVVLAKLSHSIQSLDDMKSSSPHSSFSFTPQPSDVAHHFQINYTSIPSQPPLLLSSNPTFSILFPKNALTINASLPIDSTDPFSSNFANSFPSPICGHNVKTSALAADHAFALALMPSSSSLQVLQTILPMLKDSNFDDDFIAYLTTSPYDSNLFGFPLPALTLDLPGLNLNKKMLNDLLSRMNVPSILRKQFTVQNNSTICSSASSLKKQMEAPPPSSPTWKTAFARVSSQKPSCFLYIDVDPFLLSLNYLLTAVQTANSFGALSLNPKDSSTIKSILKSIPITPTYTTLSLTGYFPSSHFQLSLSKK